MFQSQWVVSGIFLACSARVQHVLIEAEGCSREARNVRKQVTPHIFQDTYLIRHPVIFFSLKHQVVAAFFKSYDSFTASRRALTPCIHTKLIPLTLRICHQLFKIEICSLKRDLWVLFNKCSSNSPDFHSLVSFKYVFNLILRQNL